jgi:alkylation response protein AidB-like acyl-CoA dehydrogenase
MYGGAFANVFYDNVRLPSDAMVGEVNAGWKVLTGALATERGFIGGGIVMKVARSFELLCAHVRTAEVDGRPLRDDPLVRERIATLAAEIEAGRQMMMHCAAQVDGGETPPGDAAASKVYSGELMERFGEVALDILGLQATLSEGSPGAILRGRIEQNLRHSLMWVISIGTNEIQRSLIAQRGLGLPR